MRQREFKDVDEMAGFEIGLKLGQERIRGRLYHRVPPEHLTGARMCSWIEGYKTGLSQRVEDRANSRSDKLTIVIYTDGKGEMKSVAYNGYRYDRPRIVSRLAKAGAVGDVWVRYKDGRKLHREVRCGI